MLAVCIQCVCWLTQWFQVKEGLPLNKYPAHVLVWLCGIELLVEWSLFSYICIMKRKVLTLSDKSDIIRSLESGVCVTTLSKKYGVAKSTICAIKKNKVNILKITSQAAGKLKRKTLKQGEMPRMEKKLYKWFCKQRFKNLPVTSELLKAKAKSLHEEMKEKEKFSASDGWLQNFKRRFGIRFLKISGEKLSTNPELVEPFKQNLRSIIERLNLVNEQIYNADESGLFWRLLPGKTLVRSDEKTAPGRKAEKARLTFLACTNATGEHKIRPLVIGKAKNPRCFKNFTLPVDYDFSRNAWMTATIFENWFHRTFVPEVSVYFLSSSFRNICKVFLRSENI